MARRRKNLTEDDRILWKKVASTVSPISTGSNNFARADDPVKNTRSKSVAGATASKNIQGKRSKNDHRSTTTVLPPVVRANQSQPPLFDHKTRKKIVRGRMSIDARIDLHGMIQSSAHTALSSFLFRAHANNCRLVLVITGKGEAGTGILRNQVPYWLKSGELAGIVSGFDEAHRNHGGSGALYVRLKRLK